jgi:MFS family permease
MFKKTVAAQKEVFRGMNLREQRTFFIHLLYSVFDGVGQGIIALNEFVFVKDLGASTMQVSLLFQVGVFVMPFSIFMVDFLNRVRNKKRMLLLVALLTRAPLLLFAIFPAQSAGTAQHGLYTALYLFIFMLYFLSQPIVLPVLNLFTKSNYRSRRFGRLFSYSLTITQFVLLMATLSFGKLMDIDPQSYRYVFPLMGVLGFFAILLVTKIPYKEPRILPLSARLPFIHALRRTFNDSLSLLRTNRPFFDFQKGMMLYGMGFMMALPVITVYLSQQFHLSYTDIAFYKNIPIIISVVIFPFFGKLMDERDPRRFSIVSFFFAILFYVCLLIAGYLPFGNIFYGYNIIYLLLAGYLFNGLYAGSISLLWGIGSSYFTRPEHAAKYQAIHMSMTGLRGLAGPFLGVVVLHFAGYTGAFACIIIFEILAIYLMIRSLKRRAIVI